MVTSQKEKVSGLSKGFTLLELLIVIAILAVLATVAVLVINPLEYLRQARDSQRLGDVAAIKGALDLYVSATSSPSLGQCPSMGTPARCTVSGAPSPFTTNTTACGSNIGTGVNGNAANWIDVNFASMAGGSPLTKLPVDPTNNATYYYAYACENVNKTYQLDAKLESVKYSPMMTTDGGNNPSFYEVGNVLTF